MNATQFGLILFISVVLFVQNGSCYDDDNDVELNELEHSARPRVDTGVKRPYRVCQGFEDPEDVDCYMRSDLKKYVCAEPVSFNPCESKVRIKTYHYDHIKHRCQMVNVPACSGQIIRAMTLIQCLIYCHDNDPYALGKSTSVVFKLNQKKPFVPNDDEVDEREKKNDVKSLDNEEYVAKKGQTNNEEQVMQSKKDLLTNPILSSKKETTVEENQSKSQLKSVVKEEVTKSIQKKEEKSVEKLDGFVDNSKKEFNLDLIKDETKKESENKKKEKAKKEAKTEDLKKEVNEKKEEIKKEDVNKEEHKEDVKKDETKLDDVKKEVNGKNDVKKEEKKKEDGKIEETKSVEVMKEEIKENVIKEEVNTKKTKIHEEKKKDVVEENVKKEETKKKDEEHKEEGKKVENKKDEKIVTEERKMGTLDSDIKENEPQQRKKFHEDEKMGENSLKLTENHPFREKAMTNTDELRAKIYSKKSGNDFLTSLNFIQRKEALARDYVYRRQLAQRQLAQKKSINERQNRNFIAKKQPLDLHTEPIAKKELKIKDNKELPNEKSSDKVLTKIHNAVPKSDSTDKSADDGFYLWDE